MWLSNAAWLEKCRNGSLPLAGAFALALTKAVHGTLLTSDSELARQEYASARYSPV